MDPEPQAPPVVAVVVTCDPGPWFEDALRAIGAQDYPSLDVLVVDSGSTEDPARRVAAVLPDAYVRRLAANVGFAVAANEVLQVVEGASHFVFCHDDVAPDPDAFRLMIEEAYRSNAGMVAPKVVSWGDESVLLEVGKGADKSGAPALLVEPGELDQEQHDGVRDVFVAPGGCTLVRADLFATIGGYDASMYLYGEDLDLSWRAQIAGARVIVAPSARVRHLEAMSSGRRTGLGGDGHGEVERRRREVRPLQLRHRLRAVLKNYSSWHLVRVLPQLALLATIETIYGMVSGHRITAGDIVGAWRWNFAKAQRRDLRVERARVRAYRRFPDSEVRRLQARGSARVNAFLRGQLAAGSRLRVHTDVVVEAEEDVRAPVTWRVQAAVFAAVVVVLLVGSRHLITGSVPSVGEIGRFPSGPWSGFLRPFLSGWRTSGLGTDAPAPTAFGVLGLAGVAFFGRMALLQTVLVLGALPAGAVGVFRLTRPLGSRRSRLVAIVVYVCIPVPYNALARGHWSGLLSYAAMPWVLARLLRASGMEPFAEESGVRITGRDVLVLGLLLAGFGAFAPSIVLVTVLVAIGLALGGLLVGRVGAGSRPILLALGAAGVAVILLFPWSLDHLLPGSQWAAVAGVGGPARDGFSLGAVLRFKTGPMGGGVLGWAFLVAAFLPLVIGRGWRLAWAARLWIVALVCWGVAWAGGRGWLGVGLPAVEVLLAPAALALALTVALGLVAFDVDLPRYRLSWRQAAPVIAAVAVVVGILPMFAAAGGGRWHSPARDFASVLSWMPEQQKVGAFRVLWLGDPNAVPLRGWRAGPGLAYATSSGGAPDARDQWPSASPDATQLVADDLAIARERRTTQLGRLLAPMAIRYIVVPMRAAPERERTPLYPAPPDLAPTLRAQVDLKQLDSDQALLLYENSAWVPGRAALGLGLDEASRHAGAAALRDADFAGTRAALPTAHSATDFGGPVKQGDHIFVSEASSPNWHLRAGGDAAPRRLAFGWGNSFDVGKGGVATLRYATPVTRYLALLIEVGFWVAAVVLVARRRSEKGAR